jgi:hypothetical protein
VGTYEVGRMYTVTPKEATYAVSCVLLRKRKQTVEDDMACGVIVRANSHLPTTINNYYLPSVLQGAIKTYVSTYTDTVICGIAQVRNTYLAGRPVRHKQSCQ